MTTNFGSGILNTSLDANESRVETPLVQIPPPPPPPPQVLLPHPLLESTSQFCATDKASATKRRGKKSYGNSRKKKKLTDESQVSV